MNSRLRFAAFPLLLLLTAYFLERPLWAANKPTAAEAIAGSPAVRNLAGLPQAAKPGQAEGPKSPTAEDLPASAGDFAANCTPLKKACSTEMIAVQVGDLMESQLSAHHYPVCSVPRGIEEPVAEKAIIGWLSAHPEIASTNRADGIRAAIKALWNCKASVATGVTSMGVPDKSGAFVAFCEDAKNFAKCANEILSDGLAAYVAQSVNGKSSHCSFPDNVETKEAAEKVLAWLKGHKEVYGQTTEDGNADAIDHLWPCH